MEVPKPSKDKSSSNANHSDEFSEYTHDPCDYIERRKGDPQARKQFLPRNSLLTDLFENKHFQAIHRIMIILIILFIVCETTNSFFYSKKLHLGIELMLWNFSGILTALVYWLGMMASTVLFYIGFQYWKHLRMRLSKLQKSKILVKNWDYCCLSTVIIYFISFLCIPCILLLRKKLPIASSAIVATEQVRFLMKKWAFLRTNAPKILSKTQDDKENAKLSKFLYFLFAPTLVYSDSYPRKKEFQWKVVFWNFFGFAEAVFCWALLYDRFILPNFDKYGAEPFSAGDLIVKMINSTLAGLLLMMAGFYFLLHGWMNAFAEIMGFADCLFYKDWWTCSNISVYYRTWNVLVGDWLYIYVYRDISKLLDPYKGTNSRVSHLCSNVIPVAGVFLISALFHEYIITCTLGFFYPVLFTFFIGFGVLLFYPRKTEGIAGNVFILMSIGVGKGLIVSLYAMEWYSRKHCSTQMDPMWDFFTPRSWYCNKG